MASAQEQLQEYSYQTPMSFDDFWKMNNPQYGFGRETGLHLDNPNSFANKIANIFTGKVTSAKQQYENYLAGVEANNNAYYAQEANKKTWQREDTEAQRKVADIQATGLNPYLFLTSGSMGGVSSQAQSGSYKRSSKSSEKEESKMASSALKILAIIALRGLMKG